ncbi:MAG: methionine adenosyltransferase [Phycisphaera sp.]|nr:methionine adenosyltransferase [Phycisphaera sp.]
MSCTFSVEMTEGPGVGQHHVEVVERKGLGHPDSICDAIAERASVALCREYQQRFGQVLHHNCDKALLLAGQVEHKLGGGRVIEPMSLIIGDRATHVHGSETIDVRGIAEEAARQWIRQNLRFVDPDKHVRFDVQTRPGAPSLATDFGAMRANDTSVGVGFAPLTETERLVLETERYLNSPGFKDTFPMTGEDVKVMGVRIGDRLDLTVAMPLIDRFIDSEAAYFQTVDAVRFELLVHLRQRLQTLNDVTVHVNVNDRRSAGNAGMYLSVIGTSAEDADSGQVGRGNRVNGLITPGRPQSLEAAAGKNPVSHVGKVYNVLAHRLASLIHQRVPGLRDVVVTLVSRIGHPVGEPLVVDVRVGLQIRTLLQDVRGPIIAVIQQELDRLPQFTRELAEGRHPVIGPSTPLGVPATRSAAAS